jgi:hypothetical protein
MAHPPQHVLQGRMQTLLPCLIQVCRYALLVRMCCGEVGGDVAAACFVALHENPNNHSAANHPPPPPTPPPPPPLPPLCTPSKSPE